MSSIWWYEMCGPQVNGGCDPTRPVVIVVVMCGSTRWLLTKCVVPVPTCPTLPMMCGSNGGCKNVWSVNGG